MTDSQSLHNLENKNKNKKEKKYNKLALIANFFNTCSFQCPFIEKKNPSQRKCEAWEVSQLSKRIKYDFIYQGRG